MELFLKVYTNCFKRYNKRSLGCNCLLYFILSLNVERTNSLGKCESGVCAKFYRFLEKK